MYLVEVNNLGQEENAFYFVKGLKLKYGIKISDQINAEANMRIKLTQITTECKGKRPSNTI